MERVYEAPEIEILSMEYENVVTNSTPYIPFGDDTNSITNVPGEN